MYHADHALHRIPTEQLPHGAQPSVTYHLPVNRMLARCCRHACRQHAGCSSVPRPTRTRNLSDARIMRPCFRTDVCSFVQRYPAGPAYVSSIRRAYSLTAGKGRCPFEPRKGKRQGML